MLGYETPAALALFSAKSLSLETGAGEVNFAVCKGCYLRSLDG